MGVVSPCGCTVEELFDNLAAGRSGIFPMSEAIYGRPTSLVAGQVRDVPVPANASSRFAQLDRAVQFGLAAADQAMRAAALDLDEEARLRAGVYWGTGLGGATSIEAGYSAVFRTERGRVRPTAVVQGMSNSAAAHISIAYGFRGPQMNISTACASSAMSIGEAARLIRDGRAEVVLAGGSEALLTYGNLRAWEAMQALAPTDAADPSRTCKPFAADRRGLVLGEGAAAFVLESAAHAERRGARPVAVVSGYGNAGDASSMSRPDPGGQVRAMRMALDDARRDPADVDYINAHGTATVLGDVVETTAIKEAFGAHARELCVSSTKALHGHLLGAAGALEAVVCAAAIGRETIPPTAHLCHPDPACDLDYVANAARKAPLQVVMSNSFGFGGMNAVLIFERP
jgi:3-oxoacyl-[acyl-carrier-protein] synthase II